MKRWFLLALLAASAAASAQPPQPTRSFDCDNADVDSLETLCTINIAGYSTVTISGTVATAPFTDFDIALSNDGGASYITFYTDSADYTSPSGYLHSVSADPTTWSTTAIVLKLDGLGAYNRIRLQAAGTSSVATLTVVAQQ